MATRTLRVLASVLALLLVSQVVLIGFSVLAGWMLNWMLPDIGFGFSVLIALLAIGIVVHVLGRLASLLPSSQEVEVDESDDDEDFEAALRELRRPDRTRRRKSTSAR